MKKKLPRSPRTPLRTVDRPREIAPRDLEKVQGGVSGGITSLDDWEAPVV
jgi:hypothetical protein